MAILGYHFIFSAYGFWLPNDPRGSWSSTVHAFNLQKFGQATKVETTHSVAAARHDHQQRLAAKEALAFPPVEFTGHQARAIGRGFAAALQQHPYRIHALAILPDHVHLLMAYHPRHVDQIASHLKAKATAQMTHEGIHPMAPYQYNGRTPSPWARHHWCPFIRDPRHLRVAQRYVNANPIKAGLKRQRWKFVQPLESGAR